MVCCLTPPRGLSCPQTVATRRSIAAQPAAVSTQLARHPSARSLQQRSRSPRITGRPSGTRLTSIIARPGFPPARSRRSTRSKRVLAQAKPEIVLGVSRKTAVRQHCFNTLPGDIPDVSASSRRQFSIGALALSRFPLPLAGSTHVHASQKEPGMSHRYSGESGPQKPGSSLKS